MSPPVRKYLQKLGIRGYSISKKEVTEYVKRENVFREKISHLDMDKSKLHKIYFHFVRDSKRKFDFHNCCQIIADLMVCHDVIEDDNMDYFLPVPYKRDGKYYSVDKDSPGVYIKKEEV